MPQREGGVVGWRLALPRNEQGPQRLRCLLQQSPPREQFRGQRVSGKQVFDLLALERPRRYSRALFSQQLLDLTHRWWSDTEGTDIEEGDVYPLAAAVYFCIELHSARYPDPAPFQLPDPRQPARSLTDLLTTRAVLGRRQRHHVPPLHTAQAVHEVVTEEYRTLESVNFELVGDWVCLFEERFSLSVQHLRQRFVQGTGSLLSLLARSPEFFQALPCVLPVTTSGTAHSPWSPRQVASGVLLGSFRAWSGSASCCLGLAEGKASLVRSASLDACPLALPTLLSLVPFQFFFFCNFFSSQFETVG